MNKRILSMALTLAMILSLVPGTALALEPTEPGETPQVCTCTVPCAEEADESCPVCSVNPAACTAQPQEPQEPHLQMLLNDIK